jgi:hypothetical protein
LYRTPINSVLSGNEEGLKRSDPPLQTEKTPGSASPKVDFASKRNNEHGWNSVRDAATSENIGELCGEGLLEPLEIIAGSLWVNQLNVAIKPLGVSRLLEKMW